MPPVDPNKLKLDQLYAAPAFPFGEGVRGTLGAKRSQAVILTNIINIAKTAKGSLPYAPNFGSTVAEMQFEPNDQAARQQLRYYLMQDLAAQEPRAVFKNVTVIEDASDPHTMRVSVIFALAQDPNAVSEVIFGM